jgi:hypothetical protein
MEERGSGQADPREGQVDGRCERSNECVITGFRRHWDEICALLDGYAACSGKRLPTFEDNLTVPSSTVR